MKGSLANSRGRSPPRGKANPAAQPEPNLLDKEFLGGYTFFKVVSAPGVGEVEVWRNDKMEVLLKKRLSRAALSQSELVQTKIRALKVKGFQRLIAVSKEASGDVYFLEFSKKNLEDHLKICQERDQSVAEEDLMDLFKILVECGVNLEQTGDYHPALTLKNIFRIKETFKVLNPYVFDSYIDEALRIHLPASQPTKPDGLTRAEKLEINVTQTAVILLSMGLLIPEDQLKKAVKTEQGRIKLLKDLSAKYSSGFSTSLRLVLEGKLTTFSELKALLEVPIPSGSLTGKNTPSNWDISPPVDMEGERIPGLGNTADCSLDHSKVWNPTSTLSKSFNGGASHQERGLKEDNSSLNRPILQREKFIAANRAVITPQKPSTEVRQYNKQDSNDSKIPLRTQSGQHPMTPLGVGNRSAGVLEKFAGSSKEKTKPNHLGSIEGMTLEEARFRPTEFNQIQSRPHYRKDSLEFEKGQLDIKIKPSQVSAQIAAAERISLNRNLADELTFSSLNANTAVPRYSRTPISSNTPIRSEGTHQEEERTRSAQEFYRPASKSREQNIQNDMFQREHQDNRIDGASDKVSTIFNRLQSRFQRYTSSTLDEPYSNVEKHSTIEPKEAVDRRWTHNPNQIKNSLLGKTSDEDLFRPRATVQDPAQAFKEEIRDVMDRNPKGALRRTLVEGSGPDKPILRGQTTRTGGDRLYDGYMSVDPYGAHPHRTAPPEPMVVNFTRKKPQIAEQDTDADEYRIGQYQSLNDGHPPKVTTSKYLTGRSEPYGIGFKAHPDYLEVDTGSSSKKRQKLEREEEYASLYLSHLKQSGPRQAQKEHEASFEFSTGKKNRSVSFNLANTAQNFGGGVQRGRSVVKGILKKGSEEREYWSTRQDVYMHKPLANLNNFKLYTSEEQYGQSLGSERGFRIEPTPMKVVSGSESQWRSGVSAHEDRIDDKIRKLKNQEAQDQQQYRWRRGLEVSVGQSGASSYASRTPKTTGFMR